MKEKLKKGEVPFTIIANVIFKDKRLSLKAKGLFGYIYSKPNDWDFAVKRIALECSDGIRSINKGMKELEKFGFLKRNKKADGRVEYYITHDPECQNSKEAKQQNAETAPLSNTDIVTNKEQEAKASFAPLKSDSFFRKDQKDETLPMSLQEFVLMCRGSAYRHIRIIGEYAEDEDSGIPKENRGEWRKFGLRNMRAARELVPFNDRKLREAMSKLQKDLKENGGYMTKWTLETLAKYL
jgi:hypothetical protein